MSGTGNSEPSTPKTGGAPAAPESYPETRRLHDSGATRSSASGGQASKPNSTDGSLLELLPITPDHLGLRRDRESIDAKMAAMAPLPGKINLQDSALVVKDLSGLLEHRNVFAEGGHARVSSAKDLTLGRLVAVKSLKDEYISDKKIVDNFIMEARLAAQLEHPGLPPIHALGRGPDGRCFLTMKLIRGRTFREHLDHISLNYRAKGVDRLKERSSLTTRLEHFLKVCDAMSYAHSRNVIHRDLKPENIMIGEFREVYVMDWGIARIFDPSVTQTMDRQSVDGTPRYLAPEVIDGRVSTQVSDVFSLGTILFEVTTLKTAIPGSDLKEILANTLAGRFEPIVHRFPEVRIPADLKAIIAKAMAVDTRTRYHTVEALAEDVRRYLRNEEVLALPDGPMRRLTRGAYNHPALTASMLVLVIMMLGGVALRSTHQRKTAAQESKLRELRLITLQSDAYKQASKIDRLFLHIEDTLTWVGARALRHLEKAAKPTPESSDVRLYSSKDISDPATAPPDTVFSKLYRTAVSLEHPVFKLPGKLGGDPTPALTALASVGQDLSRMLLASDPLIPCDGDRSGELARRALETGLPARWCYIGTVDGALLIFPGSDTYPEEYDASKRPWFAAARDRQFGTSWGSPYIDVSGQGIVLSCSMPLRTGDGRLLGVAGLDITFDYIINNVMSCDADPAVVERHIIDGSGRIVISSKHAGKRFEIGVLDNKELKLPLFPQADVLKAAIAGKEGYLEAADHLGPAIYVFRRIHSLGWVYVEKVRADTLLASR